jgi:hypothetical protein
MSLPPLPWSYETNAPVNVHEGKGFVYLLDANGRKIGTVWGNPDEKMATVKLIMDASDMMLALEQRCQQDEERRRAEQAEMDKHFTEHPHG